MHMMLKLTSKWHWIFHSRCVPFNFRYTRVAWCWNTITARKTMRLFLCKLHLFHFNFKWINGFNIDKWITKCDGFVVRKMGKCVFRCMDNRETVFKMKHEWQRVRKVNDSIHIDVNTQRWRIDFFFLFFPTSSDESNAWFCIVESPSLKS